MIEQLDTSLVDWSRAQFALTAIYHWLFVPLTLGLAVIIGIMETIYYRTKNEFWKTTVRFWMKLFGINFAIGVATGIILEFEFGTNWSNYSWFVGDIFGAPLAVEGILAFFMEATFIAIMFFGWSKVSPRFHLVSTWCTGLGATFSAWWILVANSWMQYPVGMAFNLETVRNEMVSFSEVAFSPFAVIKFTHTVLSSWMVGAAFVIGISCWYLLRRRHREFSLASIKIAAIVGLFAALVTALSGDHSGYEVAKHQPMKLAALEGLYNGGNSQGLTVAGVLKPGYDRKDSMDNPFLFEVKAPAMLSMLATRTFDGYVPGINNILEGGYKQHDGTVALSAEQKMAEGKKAVQALSDFRKAQQVKDKDAQDSARQVLAGTAKYMGYGYISNPDQLIPNVALCFYSFRVMVALGMYFILFYAVVLFLVWKKQMEARRWLLWVALWSIPLAYIASEAGWVVAELGRQPWAIQDMLPNWAAVSSLSTSSVITTFVIFLVLFTILLIAEIGIMLKAIKQGPETLKED